MRPDSVPNGLAMKQIAMAALFALGALSLACPGCSSGAADDITIGFAAGHDPSGATEALIEEYNASNPGITVRLQAMPANTDTQHDACVTYLSAKESSIDLYSLDVIWTAEFAKAGWIAELPDGFLTAEEFLDGPVASVMYEGMFHAVPWFTDAGVLYYRADLLDAAGLPVPETWDEFFAACDAVAEPRGMDGFVWQGARYEGLVCNFLEFLWGLGGTLDAATIASDPRRVERNVTSAIELMLSLVDRGVTPESVLTYKEEDARRVFTEGHALFLRNWPYVWSMAEGSESKIAGSVGMARLPNAPGRSAYSTIGGWNVALSSFSEHPEEALDFLKFITGEHALRKRAIEGAYLPTRRSTYEDADVLAANPHFASFFEVFRGTRNRPRSPHYPRVSDAVQKYVHEALSRETTPEAAAAAIVRELGRILAD